MLLGLTPRSDYAASVEILSPPAVAKALGGKVFVQLTTGTPRQARELATWAAARQVLYLDGAIMATPHFIGQPECTILYSGDSGLFEAHKLLLEQLGGNAVYVGADMGHASTLDAAVLIVFWGSLFGSWHAAALCEAESFPLEVLGSTLRSIMPVFEDSLKDSVEHIAQRRFASDETSMASLEICHASAKLIHEMSREHGVHLGLTQALTAVFERATNAGLAADDVAAAYRVMRS